MCRKNQTAKSGGKKTPPEAKTIGERMSRYASYAVASREFVLHKFQTLLNSFSNTLRDTLKPVNSKL